MLLFIKIFVKIIISNSNDKFIIIFRHTYTKETYRGTKYLLPSSLNVFLIVQLFIIL